METAYYSLRVNTKDIKSVEEILGIQSISNDIWIHELIQKEDNEYIDCIDIFSKILIDNLILLEERWIRKEDISIWLLYNFEDQCNLEFSVEQIKKVSELGLWLNISCY